MNARLAIAFALLAAACGLKPAGEKYGAEPAYTFPHSPHIDADVACTTCHPVAQSKQLPAGARDVRIPANVTKTDPCKDCHDKELTYKPPARHEPFRVRFDHSAHLPRVKDDCKKCHAKPPEQGDKVAPAPPMGACTSCHVHQQAFNEARCMPCHVDLKGYKPETAFKHQGEWIRQHAALARPSGESCAACHDQTYCATCHASATSPTRPEIVFPERVDASYIHRGDYVSRHMVDANANPASCRSCHGTPFCDACHKVNGFSSASPGPKIRPLSHDNNWVNNVDGGNHKRDARRDISNCAACHDQRRPQNTCVTCHSAGPGTANRNPHPKSFLDAHKLSDVSKNSMCRDCHH